jgi:hypothetical protein
MKSTYIGTQVAVAVILGLFWLTVVFAFFLRPDSWPLWVMLIGINGLLTLFMKDYTSDWIARQHKKANEEAEGETLKDKLEIENWLGSKGYVPFDGSVEMDSEKNTIVFTSRSGKFSHTYGLHSDVTGQHGKYIYWVHHPYMTIRFGETLNRYYQKRLNV